MPTVSQAMAWAYRKTRDVTERMWNDSQLWEPSNWGERQNFENIIRSISIALAAWLVAHPSTSVARGVRCPSDGLRCASRLGAGAIG
jgi:hypothetical protein